MRHLLEAGLRVDHALRAEAGLHVVVDERQQHVAGGVEPAVEEDGADERLEGSRKQRGSVASATARLAASEQQVLAEADLACPAGQRRLAHEPGAQHGELALG